MKFKGNQKQFEHNAQIDSIFDSLTSATVPENKNLTTIQHNTMPMQYNAIQCNTMQYNAMQYIFISS